MEQEAEKPKVIEDPKIQNIKRIKRYFMFSLVILAVSTVITSIYYLLNQKGVLPQIPLSNIIKQSSPPSTLIPPDKIIARVGEENIFQKDLDYYLNLYFAGQEQQVKDKALEKITNDSIILQEGFKLNYIILNKDNFNSPDKNIASRSALIQIASDKIQKEFIAQISGETISMWFDNPSYPKPSIGVEAAKQIVRQKMDKFRQDILTGRLTLAEAGNRINSDKEQAGIDPSYGENSYRKFTNVDRANRLFFDPKINDLAWSLKVGEISAVTIGQDAISAGYGGPLQDAYYVIIKISNKKYSPAGTFDQWLSEAKKLYKVEVY